MIPRRDRGRTWGDDDANRCRSRQRGSSASARVAGVALTLTSVSSAHAATPWGACGSSTPESKEVARYFASPRQYYYLRCGTQAYGYRHILTRHRSDFERLAAGTYQNWRDVADLSMEAITRDPDVARPAGGNQSCLSRVIFLRNVRTNQVVRQQIVRMYVRNNGSNIATVYPASTQCPR